MFNDSNKLSRKLGNEASLEYGNCHWSWWARREELASAVDTSLLFSTYMTCGKLVTTIVAREESGPDVPLVRVGVVEGMFVGSALEMLWIALEKGAPEALDIRLIGRPDEGRSTVTMFVKTPGV